MPTLRSSKASYLAAFLLGALIALLLNWPARAADPFRLDRVGSRDSARVLVLAPGAYAVHATTAGPGIRSGTVVVEIHRLPDDATYELSSAPAKTPAAG